MRNNIVIVIVSIMGIVLGCSDHSKELIRYSEAKSLMGTVIQLDMCLENENDPSAVSAFEKAWERLHEINIRMNVYNSASDLSKINKSHQEAIKIHQDTYEILLRANDFYFSSARTFDITIWPLISLWKKAQVNKQMPDEDAIQALTKNIGLEYLEFLPDYQVKRLNDVIMLDLGGIAKGYAIDEVARIFREHGFSDFYIDAGGDLYVGGTNCLGQTWRIGIRDPRGKSKVYKVVKLSDQALTTSGNYERFVEINGQRYSHIIDPRSGYPQKDIISASVIALSAEEADVYATALTVMGWEEGIAFINQLGDPVDALVLKKSPQGKIIEKASQNFHSREDKSF